jgi:hypothetical protein
MDLVLLQDWNGLPSGRPLFGVQNGQAELMILRGIAKQVEAKKADSGRQLQTDSSHGTNNGRSDNRTSQKAVRNR